MFAKYLSASFEPIRDLDFILGIVRTPYETSKRDSGRWQAPEPVPDPNPRQAFGKQEIGRGKRKKVLKVLKSSTFKTNRTDLLPKMALPKLCFDDLQIGCDVKDIKTFRL